MLVDATLSSAEVAESTTKAGSDAADRESRVYKVLASEELIAGRGLLADLHNLWSGCVFRPAEHANYVYEDVSLLIRAHATPPHLPMRRRPMLFQDTMLRELCFAVKFS